MNNGENRHRLWYEQAASAWPEALPLGNGRIGVMVYGGAHTERLCLNEDTLWGGYPQCSQREGMAEVYHRARSLVLEGKKREAQRLLEAEFGDFLIQPYLPLGDVVLEFSHGEETVGYRRELSLKEACHTVSYRVGDTAFRREMFVSAPAQVMALRLTASQTGLLEFAVRLESPLKNRISCRENEITIEGNCPVCLAPYGTTHAAPEKRFYFDDDARKGVGYRGILHIETDGTLQTREDCLMVSDAGEAVLYFAVRTSFAGFDRHPVLEGREYREAVRRDMDAAVRAGFAQLRTNHIADHAALYDRTELVLADSRISPLATDERLRRHAAREEDNALYALLFHFGRYLLIASSRPGTQAANLQGIWNDQLVPPWSSNYTLNINTEMNYWMALKGNLAECQQPLDALVQELARQGRDTAKRYYGAEGFVSHHATDLWRTTHPSTNLLPGSAQWGFWPMSGGWLCRHLFERYRYTGDKAFLRNTAWPVMKQAARFYVSLLQEDADGTVYLTPSTSPENGYLLEGERCTVDKTATMTTAILRELFENLLTCGERLGIRDELLDMVRGLLVRLKPYKISETGALMEWNQDYPEAEVTHRHLSHLYGLYPGNDTALHTPALREACRQTLLRRSDEGTGWSMAWKVCLWARLGDGEHAKQLIDRQLRPVSGGETGHDAGGGSYSSLLCAHPPFQIDGNFGVCAGIAEMLCDDTDDQPRLLPALPAAWTEGAVRGMRIRGGAVVDFSWKNGRVTACHMAGAAAEDAD